MFPLLQSQWCAADLDVAADQYKGMTSDPMIVERCYSAQLIGKESSLVIHGGGNTSVKTTVVNDFGETVAVLAVKGSGHDLATIGPSGHPLVELPPLLALEKLAHLDDFSMVRHLKRNMIDPQGATPSVETLLHAFLPHTYIDHTHADAVLAVINHTDGAALAREVVGKKLLIIPYIMPGFDLAKRVAQEWQKFGNKEIEGLVLLHHGLFTFADSAKESYERMLKWVNAFSEKANAHSRVLPKAGLHKNRLCEAAQVGGCLRTILGQSYQESFVVRERHTSLIAELLVQSDLSELTRRGPATPDHIIRTKKYPLVLKDANSKKSIEEDLANFINDYQAYFSKHNQNSKDPKTCLDPYPRLVIAPGVGLFAVGRTAKDCEVALDIYEHTIEIILQSETMGAYHPLADQDLFDMEYWSLEQAKLGKKKSSPYHSKVIWISGAGSGIGLATTKLFLSHGANVMAVDWKLSDDLKMLAREYSHQLRLHECDICCVSGVAKSFEATILAFGGVDTVISNAGRAFTGEMASLSRDELDASMEINFYSHFEVTKAAYSWMKNQGTGEIIVNVSKSALNPGPGFGPYSLAKASLLALVRQLAVEWGGKGIRVNAINADRVVTGLFTSELLQERAQARGLSVEDYLAGNILKQEVDVNDVAEAFWVTATTLHKTTGAIIPVDGGNAAAFPR